MALIVVLFGGEAVAQRQDRSFSPQLFHPAPGPDEFVTIEPAAPLRHKGYSVGLYFNYARNQFSIFNYNPVDMAVDGTRANVLAHALSMDVWGAYGFLHRFQVAIALPMTLYQTGQDFLSPNPAPGGTTVRAPNGFAFGDPRLHLKARLYGKDRGIQVALSHWLGFPFGADDNFGGEKHFTGFTGEGRALVGWEAEKWRLGASLGFLWRANTSQFFSTEVGQQLTYGGAFAIDVVARRLTLIAEIFGRKDFTTDVNASPLELDVSGRVTIIPGLNATVGIGNGIVAGLGSPQPRVFLGFVWAPDLRDSDKDGVSDSVDRCPDQPEDRDGFQDRDGCPDPDNDGDLVLDADDRCPNDKEDLDDYQDEDGCPEADNDGDGIDDLHDSCPREPEDAKGDKPSDGCPLTQTDSDGDGLSDAVDKCPKDAEDKDGFEDEDGCPDPDNDGDGVPDEFDQCRDLAEDADGVEDDDGCPDPDQVKLEGGQLLPQDKLAFDAQNVLLPASLPLLDQVVLWLKIKPEMKLRIEGYTETMKQEQSLQISQAQADAVRAYLQSKGVDAGRLVAVGYGAAQPIADNKSKAGREKNRRVELHVVDEEPKKSTGEPEGQPEENPSEGEE